MSPSPATPVIEQHPAAVAAPHHFDIGRLLGLVALGAGVALQANQNPRAFVYSLTDPNNLAALIAGIMHIVHPDPVTPPSPPQV